MSSFVDAHTPSESPDASSSESSAGGDWESGEFSKTNENVVDWPKQRRVMCSKRNFLENNKSNFTASFSTSINTSPPTLSTITTTTTTTATTVATTIATSSVAKFTQNNYKTKSNSPARIANNNHSKTALKKMRWLSNMRSDPDFRETFVKSVIIQPRQSFDSLDVTLLPATTIDRSFSLNATNDDGRIETMMTSPSDSNSSIDLPIMSLESQSNDITTADHTNDLKHKNFNSILSMHSNIINDIDLFSLRSPENHDTQIIDVCDLNVMNTTNESVSENIEANNCSSLALFETPCSSRQLVNVSSTKFCESSLNKRLPFTKTKLKNEIDCQTQRRNSDVSNGTSVPASALVNLTKRNSRYTPFTFREIRNELRTVMRQNSNKKF